MMSTDSRIPCNRYCAFNLLLKIILFFAMVVHMILYALSNEELGYELSSFYNSPWNVSLTYRTEITPEAWFYYMDYIVYIWQFAIVLFILVSACMRSPALDEPMIEYKTLFTPYFTGVYAIVFILHTAWIYYWDRAYFNVNKLPGCLALHFVLLAVVIGAVHLARYELYKSKQELTETRRTDLMWTIRLLILTGLTVYATWVLHKCMLNLCAVLVHYTGITGSYAATTSLVLLLIVLIAATLIDLILIDGTNRYNFGVYAVNVWTSAAIFTSKNYLENDTRSWIIAAVFLAFAGLCTVVKIVMCVLRHMWGGPNPRARSDAEAGGGNASYRRM